MKPQEVEEMAKHGPNIRSELQALVEQVAAFQTQFQPVAA
jgi:hypothetical protein